MIFDKIENFDRYKEFADYAEQIKLFIEKDNLSIFSFPFESVRFKTKSVISALK